VNSFGLVSFHFMMICSYKLWMVRKVEHKEHWLFFSRLFIGSLNLTILTVFPLYVCVHLDAWRKFIMWILKMYGHVSIVKLARMNVIVILEKDTWFYVLKIILWLVDITVSRSDGREVLLYYILMPYFLSDTNEWHCQQYFLSYAQIIVFELRGTGIFLMLLLLLFVH